MILKIQNIRLLFVLQNSKSLKVNQYTLDKSVRNLNTKLKKFQKINFPFLSLNHNPSFISSRWSILLLFWPQTVSLNKGHLLKLVPLFHREARRHPQMSIEEIISIFNISASVKTIQRFLPTKNLRKHR